MSFWTAAVIIVAITVLGEMYMVRLRSLSRNTEDIIKNIERRMTQMEKRMANIETIVLEKEKEHRFDSM